MQTSVKLYTCENEGDKGCNSGCRHEGFTRSAKRLSFLLVLNKADWNSSCQNLKSAHSKQVKILVQKQRNGKSSINRDMKPKGGNDWIGELSCTLQMHGTHVMLSPFTYLGQKKLTKSSMLMVFWWWISFCLKAGGARTIPYSQHHHQWQCYLSSWRTHIELPLHSHWLPNKQSQIQSFFTKTVTKWHKLNEALKYLNTKFVVSTFQQINYHL